jgi:hypothetical protein
VPSCGKAAACTSAPTPNQGLSAYKPSSFTTLGRAWSLPIAMDSEARVGVHAADEEQRAQRPRLASRGEASPNWGAREAASLVARFAKPGDATETTPDASRSEEAAARVDELAGSCGTKRRRQETGCEGQLVIMGVGLKAMCHITHEALVCLRAADVVFAGLDATGPDRRWLELTLGTPVLDLNQFYPFDPAADRAQCYVRSAAAVLEKVSAAAASSLEGGPLADASPTARATG